ncbi:MAG: dipicolinate synthase subunit B [Clostridiales bacterium]|jgi:dipicolinate synthase subunit B|nr:dipicolinate synthase subunit B [Clostridiales bacterium]
MEICGAQIGFAITGSFCTIEKAFRQIQNLMDAGAVVCPILSFHAAAMDTRFITAEDLNRRLGELTGRSAIKSIAEAEPIGPKKPFDLVMVLPCTGNTTAKIASGITDTPVAMAVKAQLRNERPVLIALSTNDGLSANAKNIGALLNVKHIYFAPFYQDDPVQKPRSLLFHDEMILPAAREALCGRQIQPVLHR